MSVLEELVASGKLTAYGVKVDVPPYCHHTPIVSRLDT